MKNSAPNRSIPFRSTLTALASASLLLATVAHAQSIGVADATLKIRPTQSLVLEPGAQLKAAANEFEPFQIVVQGGGSGASNVSATAGALTGPGGSIPASSLRLYRLGYLNIATPSSVDGATGQWPDPLIPDVDPIANQKRNAFPFNVPAGENRVIFVDLHVPKGTAAGRYTGQVAVSVGGNVTPVPISLDVLPFEIPSTSSLPSTFGIGWDATCVAHHGSYNGCGGDSGIINMNSLYTRFMLDHRITAEFVYTGPRASGSSYDWTNSFDNHYSPLIEGTATGMQLEGAKATSVRYIWTEQQARYSAWAEHFRRKGWFDKTYHYTCDEPPMTCAWSDIRDRATTVHAADPEMRTLVTTSLQDATSNGVLSHIDLLVPVVNHMHDKGSGTYGGNQRAKYDAFLRSGPTKELWWYQSCMSHGCGTNGGSYFSGWPSYMVDASGVQNRAMNWLTFKYDIRGELYWSATYMLRQAWSTVYAFGGNGDGTLLYPGTPAQIGGTTHIPVASYRLKMIREGMEDYEYLHRLAQLGEGEWARGVVNGLFPNAYSTIQPVAALRSARNQLADRLAQRLGGQTPVDPEPTDPTDPEPTDPTDPEPTDPTDPEPTDPTDPEPTDPTDPEPTDPTHPEPTDPTNPEPTDPVIPVTPVTPPVDGDDLTPTPDMPGMPDTPKPPRIRGEMGCSAVPAGGGLAGLLPVLGLGLGAVSLRRGRKRR